MIVMGLPSGKSPEGLKTRRDSLFFGPACWLRLGAWLTVACMLLERSVPDTSHLAGLGYTTCQLGVLRRRPPCLSLQGKAGFTAGPDRLHGRPTEAVSPSFSYELLSGGGANGDEIQQHTFATGRVSVPRCHPRVAQCLAQPQQPAQTSLPATWRDRGIFRTARSHCETKRVL